MKSSKYYYLIVFFLIFTACEKKENKTALEKDQCRVPPYTARFVSSLDYYFLPYFEIRNTSRSNLDGIELLYDNAINITVYTIPSLAAGETYKLNSPMPTPGDVIHVHFPEMDCINTYYCNW